MGKKETVCVDFQTPMRVKVEGALPKTLSFQGLISHVVRRVHGVFETYGEGEPKWDYPALIHRAGEVVVVRQDLAWMELERWSTRQRRMVPMGGLKGSVVYSGDLKPFYPLLKLGESLHVGKNTMFGLGRMQVTWPDIEGENATGS